MIELNRRNLMAGGAVAGALTLLTPMGAMAQDCSAEEWPCQTIEVVSHASAGGGTDTSIRMWLDAAGASVDEDIRVVYKQGGGSRAAHEYLVSKGDNQHTIVALTQTHLYTIARGNSPLSIDDITGIARAMDDPSLIVVRPDSDINTYEELVSASKEKALNWGVAQVGGTEHIGISRWAEKAGTQARIVPFGSGGDMITSLRSGAVDATLANVSEALDLVKENELKPIALLYKDRVADLPDVPTAAEFGDDISVTTTRGYYTLASVDPAIIAKMEKMILDAMQGDRFQDYLRSSGLDPATNIAGAAEWDKQMKDEYQVSLEALRKLDMTEK